MKTEALSLKNYFKKTDTVRIFWFCVFAILGQVSLYLVFVCLAIFNTAARENALDQTRFYLSQTAEYEYRYLGLEEGINLEKAASLGFSNGELRTVFVFADTAKTAGVLAQNDL